jgi:CBS domain-containing protein
MSHHRGSTFRPPCAAEPQRVHMPNAFNFSASPFDCLTLDEQRLVRDSVDIAYYRAGRTILELGATPTHLFVIIKGYVSQFDGDEVVATYGPDDCFDGRGLVAGRTSSRFAAAEEVVSYQLARQAVSDLIASNSTFGALLFSDLGSKLGALSQRQSQHELQSLALARVDEAFLRPAHAVDFDTDILTVVRLFQEHRTSNVLVRDCATDPPALGIFTATALQRAILDGTPLDRLPVGKLSKFPLIEVRPSDQVGEALAMMLMRRVHRVVVRENGKVMGILEALDLFSFLSNHSHLISTQIELATDLETLAQAAGKITRMIALLHRGGTRVALIAQLVQDLNGKLFDRAWRLIAPPELVAASCLFVMGSEGRGEQILKTDQDNGLILRDGYEPPPDLDELCGRFSGALASFGYPECPGRIMVNNPEWRAGAAAFGTKTRQWLLTPTPESLMNLAIFLDARAVCGDASLLEEVRSGLMALATDNDAMLARFAAAIDSFGTTSGWWNRLLAIGDAERHLDIKKAALFPLVHGVRSLALARHVFATSTLARIEALVADSALDPEMGRAVADSLSFFMGLRLKAGLAELDVGREVSGIVDVEKLSSLDRDLLKDTLGVVKRFKSQLRVRFRLDSL